MSKIEKIIMLIISVMIGMLIFYNVLIKNIKIVNVTNDIITIEIFGAEHNYLYM